MKNKIKNAFTLIELLAVIVILAIIALIATPIILGIVEDARRDAFFRSVELVVSSTNLDIMNKLTDEGYKYELVDGKIFDTGNIISSDYEIGDRCEAEFCFDEDAEEICNNEASELFDGMPIIEYVKANQNSDYVKVYLLRGVVKEVYRYKELSIAKNTKEMNGSILYDAEGKEIYAIHNGVYCVLKNEKMQKAEIRDYVEGGCSPYLTFSEFVNDSSGEGNKILSGDGQLIDLGDYGIRFQGDNPNNYVYFNCSDYNNQSAETCELWRIIGIVDGKVKLISKGLEERAWDDNSNDWNTSTLKTYLNGEYYNSFLSKNTQNGSIISPSTWYLRGYNDTDMVSEEAIYDLERKTGVIMYETEKIDNTNIGLMYPSDWVFAGMENEATSRYITGNWIAQTTPFCYEWLITPNPKYTNRAFVGHYYGGVLDFYLNQTPSIFGVRATLYLTSEIEFRNGDGSLLYPYQIIPN